MPHVTSHPHGSFAWYDLFSKNLEASQTFYAGLFGWTPQEQPAEEPGREPYVMFLRDGVAAAGGGQMNKEMIEGGTPQVWNAYVTVNELEPVLERVEANGGRVIFPATDVMDVGRLAYFSDPEGAILALWQPKKNVGAGVVNEAHTVCWVELLARDMNAAASFYSAVFAWTTADNPSAPPSGYRTIMNGDQGIGGIMQLTEEWGDVPSHWSLYFEVEDVDASTARVSELGGAVKKGPFDIPVGRISVCADDGGAHFYLLQLTDEMKAAR